MSPLGADLIIFQKYVDTNKMRFIKKHIPLGSNRMLKRFAFIPTELNNGDILWLETYFLCQKYDYHLGVKYQPHWRTLYKVSEKECELI